MSRRLGFSIYAGHSVLLLALFAVFVSAAIATDTSSQAANLVLGQVDFVSGSAGTSASRMSGPHDVTIDPVSGKVFVADTFNNRVLRFASSAALVNGAAAEGVLGQPDFIENTAAATASGMGRPESVAVDSNGRLWVADYSDHRVLRFDDAAHKANGADADGVLGQPDFSGSFFATTASGMGVPSGVAVDTTDHLWVADGNNHRVLRFDHATTKANGADADGVLGQSNFTSGTLDTTVSGMQLPQAVAADSAGTLWVADTFNNRVLRFDHATTKANGAAADGVLGQPDFTTPSSGTTASGMQSPQGVAVGSGNTLWVADTDNNRVLRFNTLGQTITFDALPPKTVDTPPFIASATSSSNLTVTIESLTPDVCIISGSTVILRAVGSCILVAHQNGNSDYTAAVPVMQSFIVTPTSGTRNYLPLVIR